MVTAQYPPTLAALHTQEVGARCRYFGPVHVSEKARGCAGQVLLNGEVIGVLERSNPRNLSLPNDFGSASPNGDVRIFPPFFTGTHHLLSFAEHPWM